MKKRTMSFFAIIIFSLGLNLYLGVDSYIKSTYTPNLDDQEILGEMTMMVLESDKYKEIASKEKIYSITQGVSRFNVSNPESIFHYEIYVKTKNQTYIFTCEDEVCSSVSNGGWTYSRYNEEKTILPLNQKRNAQ